MTPAVSYGLLDPKGICCAGISISKGQQGFTLSFTGSIDLVYSKFYTHNKIGYARKEDIPEEDFLNPFR